jgi:hypothetical protein
MSVGCFIGIRASYTDQAQDAATAYLAAINAALRANGVPAYVDPPDPPDVYTGGLFGRSALDHHSARCLAQLGESAAAHGPAPHLELLGMNPYRVAFVPVDFEQPLPTDYTESIAGDQVGIWVGSASRLAAELVSVAPLLGIPLEAGRLTDTVARKINDFAPLFEGDDCALAEDERTAWLLLYEGARLAVQHGVALSLAG